MLEKSFLWGKKSVEAFLCISSIFWLSLCICSISAEEQNRNEMDKNMQASQAASLSNWIVLGAVVVGTLAFRKREQILVFLQQQQLLRTLQQDLEELKRVNRTLKDQLEHSKQPQESKQEQQPSSNSNSSSEKPSQEMALLRRELEDLTKRLESSQASLESATSTNKRLQNTIKEYEQSQTKHKKDSETLEKENSLLKKQLHEETTSKKAAVAEKNNASTANNAKNDELKDKYEEQLANLKKQLTELQQELTRSKQGAEQEKGTLTRELEQSKDNHRKINDDYQKQRTDWTSQQEHLRKELESFQSLNKHLQTQLESASRDKEKERESNRLLEGEVSRWKKEADDSNKRIKSVEALRMQELKQSEQDLSQRISDIKKDYDSRLLSEQNTVKTLSEKLQVASTEIEELKKAAATTRPQQQEVQTPSAQIQTQTPTQTPLSTPRPTSTDDSIIPSAADRTQLHEPQSQTKQQLENDTSKPTQQEVATASPLEVNPASSLDIANDERERSLPPALDLDIPDEISDFMEQRNKLVQQSLPLDQEPGPTDKLAEAAVEGEATTNTNTNTDPSTSAPSGEDEVFDVSQLQGKKSKKFLTKKLQSRIKLNPTSAQDEVEASQTTNKRPADDLSSLLFGVDSSSTTTSKKSAGNPLSSLWPQTTDTSATPSDDDDTAQLMALLDQKAKTSSTTNNNNSFMDLFSAPSQNNTSTNSNGNQDRPNSPPPPELPQQQQPPLQRMKSKAKAPAWMELFQPPTPEQDNSSEGPTSFGVDGGAGEELLSIADIIQRDPWSPGRSIIRDYCVKEDMNVKGMRRGKRVVKPNYMGKGSTNKFEMEDQHLICVPFPEEDEMNNAGGERTLFCVFDGHAGKNCAIAAKKEFPKQLHQVLVEEGANLTDLSHIFRKVYLSVDSALAHYEYEGCTSTTVLVWTVGGQRYLQAANVGDSSAFLKRGNTVTMLSKDHKATDASERQRIADSGIDMLPTQTRVGGLAVSRALGDHFLKQERLGVIAEPYISPAIPLDPLHDSILIVASDGLWDVMTGEKAMEICSPLSSADAMAKRLLSTALADSQCKDNITIIVATL